MDFKSVESTFSTEPLNREFYVYYFVAVNMFSKINYPQPRRELPLWRWFSFCSFYRFFELPRMYTTQSFNFNQCRHITRLAHILSLCHALPTYRIIPWQPTSLSHKHNPHDWAFLYITINLDKKNQDFSISLLLWMHVAKHLCTRLFVYSLDLPKQEHTLCLLVQLTKMRHAAKPLFKESSIWVLGKKTQVQLLRASLHRLALKERIRF